VDIEVDTRLVDAAAHRAVAAAYGLRELAAGCARLPEGLREQVVAHGLGVLSDAVADAFEVVALDLALVARRLRAGAEVYDSTEQALTGADPRG
jgi:hypothetical protein